MKKIKCAYRAGLIIFLLLSYSLTFAFTVDGTIYDVETNEIIEDAMVYLILDNLYMVDSTDENGNFHFFDIEEEYYSFMVTAIGHLEYNSAFTVSEDMIYDAYLEVQPENGFLNGTVTFDGGTGNMQSILITAGDEETNPDVDGNYSIEIQPGTYDVTATLEYYSSDTVTVIVEEEMTTDNVDLNLVYCDPPQNLTVDEEIGLFTWNVPASGNPTGYNIYLNHNLISTVGDNVLDYTFGALENEAQYVAGISAIYNGYTSEVIEIDFTYTPFLDLPTNLQVDEATGLFTWDAPASGNQIGYNVYLNYAFLDNVSDQEFQFEDLVNEQLYIAGVSAVYETETTDTVQIYFTFTPILNPPSNLEVGGTTGLFTWNAPEVGNLTGYNIYLDSDFLENIIDTEFQFENLTDEQSYTAGITAVFEEGTSEMIEVDFTYTATSTQNDAVPSIGIIGNYPNPFNPTTTISYTLLQQESVNITIYNMIGQKIRTVVNEIASAGNHQITWTGKDDNNQSVSSGIYFYKMITKHSTSTKKMILIK